MRRRQAFFWGVVLTIIGIFLWFDVLKENIRLPIFQTFHFSSILFPILLIFLGVWFLLGRTLLDKLAIFDRKDAKCRLTNDLTIPLENIRSGKITFRHGAGRLHVSVFREPDVFFQGMFSGGAQTVQNLSDDGCLSLEVSSTSGTVFFPVETKPWEVGISPHIPIELEVVSGANESELDLTELFVTHLKVDMAASSTRINLPARVNRYSALIKAGAASIDILVPDEVAARISVRTGLSGIDVNSSRFPRNGDVFESPDFSSAARQVEIFVETSLGSVTIK
ncbi:MAG TPA: hypothetical protein PKW33_08760 [Anaerolineaceae bacterium]|nr:hypothetical protein [Anaerolineaceae bacterium]HPN51665.1 hypothetical protein [Anaerolineaceae bacterium]